ncbi:hypothetical protein V496_00339 [Pseudogymnoascus sp. VKM F-4515 (FW-2607)]|nr:hypothetical protein V496_00339 [Pseudogymnoascus sp. VKM F-4515 (FW-2607)]
MATSIPIPLVTLSSQTQTPYNLSSQPSLFSSLESQSQPLLSPQLAPAQPLATAQPQAASQSLPASQTQNVNQPQTQSQPTAQPQTVPQPPGLPPETGRFQKLWNRITPFSSWRHHGIEKPKDIKANRRTRYVHIATICASVALLVLNRTRLSIRSHLSGPIAWEYASKLQAFQIVSKMHEIAILSSLGVVVFDVVRQQLLFDNKGVPLGMAGLGFTFSQGDYLVAEFDFLLNGTIDELWPSTLEGQHIGGAACIDTDGAATDSSCIGGGYPIIHNHFTAFTQQHQSSSFDFDTEGRLGQRTIQGNIRNEPRRAMWSYNLRYLTNIWAKRDDYSDSRGATVKGEVPAVRVACVPIQNLPSQSSVAFPVLEEYGFWKPSSREIFDVGPTADLDIGNFSDQLQNSSEAGLLVATSSKPENTITFNLGIACSVDTRWALITTSISGTRSGWAFASCGKPSVSEISNKRASTNDYGGYGISYPSTTVPVVASPSPIPGYNHSPLPFPAQQAQPLKQFSKTPSP